MKKIKYLKIVSLFGVIGAVFYFLHVFFGTIFYDGYNSCAQAISDLTASDSPSKKIALAFSFIYGILTVVFSITFFAHIKGKINKRVTFGSCFYCIMTIISFLGYTFFPLSEAGYAGTFQDIMHIAVTIAVVSFTIISLILFIIGFFGTKKLKYPGVISSCTFLLLAAGSILMNYLPKEYFGIAERINVYSIVIYGGLLSLWMYGHVPLQCY